MLIHPLIGREETRLTRRPVGLRHGLAALLLMSASFAACSEHPVGVDGHGPTTLPPSSPPECLDIDQDGFISVTCGGQDCNDTEPYINPAAVDGPWSYQLRTVGNEESVRWFSLDEDGTTHWVTKITNDLHSQTSLDLRYARADDVDFGVPHLMAAEEVSGKQVSLWTQDPTAHALMMDAHGGALHYAAEASSWTLEPIASGVTDISALVQHEGQWHALFATGSNDPVLHHAIRTDGAWSVSELGPGSPAGLYLMPDGELHRLTAAGDDACFQHGHWIDGSWTLESFEDDVLCTIIATAKDSAGHLYVLYRAQGMHLVTNASGSWETLDAPQLPQTGGAGFEAKMLVGDDGTIHLMVAYFISNLADVDPLDLWYYENGDGWWKEELVGRQDSAAMALDDNGEPVIVFSRTINHGIAPQLVVARRTGNDGVDQNCDGIDGSEGD